VTDQLATRAISPVWPISLTPMQKLHALGNRFYSHVEWEPKAGDLYTTARPDLELYQIARIKDGIISTRYRDPRRDTMGTISEWREAEFLSPETFGYARVWVPDWVVLEVQ
jgi:hypothetical protein